MSLDVLRPLRKKLSGFSAEKTLTPFRLLRIFTFSQLMPETEFVSVEGSHSMLVRAAVFAGTNLDFEPLMALSQS